MKKLLFSIILLVISFGAKAQYPLPSTTVFGNLTVQDTVTFTGGYVPFSSNILNFGYGDLPFTGAGGAYGNGVFLNGIADFSAVGFPNHLWAAGYLSNGGLSFIQTDTSATRIRAFSQVGEDYQFQTSLEIFSDTSISGAQQLFSLNARAPGLALGYVDISSQVDTKLRLQLSAFDRYDQQISYLGIDTEYVAIVAPLVTIAAPEVKIQSNLKVVGYNTYPQFAVQSGSGQNVMSFLPYSALNNSMDFYVQTSDTSRAVGQATLQLNPYTGFNVTVSTLLGSPNRIAVDTVGVYLTGGSDGTQAKVNSNGLVLPSKSSEPTGENGAMYYNSVTNTARVFENGAWRNL